MLSILKELLNLLPNFEYVKGIFLNKMNESTILIECFLFIEKNMIHTDTSENEDNLNDDNHHEKHQYLFLMSALKEKIYEIINIGHWNKVNLIYRHAFTLITFLEILFRLLTTEILSYNELLLDKLLYDLDYGLLMGCPLDHHEHLLSKSIDILTNEMVKMKTLQESTANQLNKNLLINSKRSKNELCEITKLTQPNILEFHEKYFLTETPCLLLNCIDHWPALEKWKQLNYLVIKAGERIVPIEVGSRYTNDDWSQELIKFKEFFNRQINENITDDNNKQNKQIEYLAQHNLFDQIPSLKNDIFIPEYCYCSNSEEDSATVTPKAEVNIKAWLGPKGTISPMHYDAKHNLLCQIFGHKLIILASPKDSKNLYPHDGSLLTNTSKIDAEHLDLQIFPLLKNVQFYKFNLYAGEMVYIPLGWWHYIKSLDKSFSVSFWWT